MTDTYTIPDWRLRDVETANQLIGEGKIPVSLTETCLPVPVLESLEGWDHGRWPVAFKHTDLGELISPQNNSTLYELQPKPNGDPVPELVGWQLERQIVYIKAILRGHLAVVELEGQQVEIPINPGQSLHELIDDINAVIAADKLPYYCTEIEQDDTVTNEPHLRIANEDVILNASSLVWSPEDQALVACALIHTDVQSIRAITATLYKNNRGGYLKLYTPNYVYIEPTRRRHITVSRPFNDAVGTVTALMHPQAGNPQMSRENGEYFYVIAAPDENGTQLFGERLNLAIPYPILSGWFEYLLLAGIGNDLVWKLPVAGKDWNFAIRVSCNQGLWAEIIQNGLENGQIAL